MQLHISCFLCFNLERQFKMGNCFGFPDFYNQVQGTAIEMVEVPADFNTAVQDFYQKQTQLRLEKEVAAQLKLEREARAERIAISLEALKMLKTELEPAPFIFDAIPFSDWPIFPVRNGYSNSYIFI